MLATIASQRNCYTEIIEANSSVAGANYMAWKKPPKLGWLHFFLIGGGGGGGSGAIGANSTAAGGGGGGSAAQSSLLVPAWLLPDILYILVGAGGAPSTAGITSRIMISPDTIANHTLLAASGGGAGGNAAGATAGAAGVVGAVGTFASSCFSGIGQATFIGGQAGSVGGVAVSAASVTIPATGLVITGGAGGGGLPAAAAAAGTAGGSIATVALPTRLFPVPLGGAAPATAITPSGNGDSGYNNPNGVMFSFGGAGGSSTHGTATGVGLVQSNGGNGGYGSGGGGSGGALTGSTAGVAGRGGNGRLYITGW